MSQPIIVLSPPSTPAARKRARLDEGDASASKRLEWHARHLHHASLFVLTAITDGLLSSFSNTITLSFEALKLLAENAEKLLMIQQRADLVRQRLSLQIAQAEAARANDEARRAEHEASAQQYEFERTQLELKKAELELKAHQLRAKK